MGISNLFSWKSASAAKRLAEEIEILHNSQLVDPVWYRQAYADLRDTPVDVARHYLEHGAAEARNPHPLFDTKFYLEQYPDVAASGMNALVHYLLYGTQEGRNPNPFFDTSWYLEKHPDILKTDLNPLVHYSTVGEAIGADPSERFDVKCYLLNNLDVARSGKSPLSHFLQFGLNEGRKPNADYLQSAAVIDADIVCLKKPLIQGEVALFVTHSPDGKLKPHVRYHLGKLNQQHISTILVVATNANFSGDDPTLLQTVSGIFVRQNVGYDFAAWAHVLRLIPEIFNAKILYLINDSIVGPINDRLFDELLTKIRTSPADFLGLTDNYEFCWHIQSFFLAFKERALSSAALGNFIDRIVSHTNKTRVIAEYETQLASVLAKAGLNYETIFPAISEIPVNRTIFEWKSLIYSGFPFIKVTTIRDHFPGVDISDWREILSEQGFNVSLAESMLTGFESEKSPLIVKTEPPALVAVNLPSASEFSPEFYLAAYPDVAAAGLNPYDHYIKHGRAEGRLPRSSALDALENLEHSIDITRETVLVISHEGLRGGAPILAYNLVKGLLEKYNVIALFLGPGPILEACRDLGAIVIGPISLAGAMSLSELVVTKISHNVLVKFAIVNSIESRYILPALAKRYIPTISLIHEFAAYIRPESAFREAVLWSGQCVFSAEITRDNAITEYPELANRDYPIIAQGRSIVPKEPGLQAQKGDGEDVRIRQFLRPEGFPSDGIVILGAGQVEFRKGVDLFIDCAARVIKYSPDLPFRFVWIGRGYNPARDVGYSVYLQDQIHRAGVDQNVFFVNETSELEAAFDEADLFLLSSRLDPLPNVAIDALSCGLPLICFEKTTGIVDILNKNGLGELTVAEYLNTGDMAQKVIALSREKRLYAEVAIQSSKVASTAFNMANYLAQLEGLAEREATRSEQERLDVETIMGTDLPQFEYYLLGNKSELSHEEIIRGYVRSWASGINRRKLFPGFHPGIYFEQRGVEKCQGDPLADYLRAGRPKGPWNCEVITAKKQAKPIPSTIRVGLHIHAYYPDILPEILRRLGRNKVRPDLLISVNNEDARRDIENRISTYPVGRAKVCVVPNRGRDIGPFLTEFGDALINEYDLIGHLHTKKTADLADKSVGEKWYRFLLENLLGTDVPMADTILSWMVKDPTIGMVFPDDPHIVGWDKNKRFAVPYLRSLSSPPPDNFYFPVGTMFWARPMAIKSIFDLGLTWSDYPSEPLPFDGSLVHGLERLFGLVVTQSGYNLATTSCAGVTR